MVLYLYLYLYLSFHLSIVTFSLVNSCGGSASCSFLFYSIKKDDESWECLTLLWDHQFIKKGSRRCSRKPILTTITTTFQQNRFDETILFHSNSKGVPHKEQKIKKESRTENKPDRRLCSGNYSHFSVQIPIMILLPLDAQ